MVGGCEPENDGFAGLTFLLCLKPVRVGPPLCSARVTPVVTGMLCRFMTRA